MGFLQINASPNGAPQRDDVCLDLLPRHGASPQTQLPPFEVIHTVNNIKGGERVKVTIRSTTGSDRFKGFLLQARTYNATNANNFDIVGEFFAIQNDQSESSFNFRNCLSKRHNCVTHASNSDKESISLEWKAPYDYKGKIYFM